MNKHLFVLVLMALILPLVLIIIYVAALFLITTGLPVSDRVELIKTAWDFSVEKQTLAATVSAIIGVVSYVYGNQSNKARSKQDDRSANGD